MGKTIEACCIRAQIQHHDDHRFTLPIGLKLQALAAATDPSGSQALLEPTYKIVRALAEKSGLVRMGDLLNRDMPDAGIYLFFDEREMRLKDISTLRIVRVGTHGVAEGSKASLRNRMRTYYGTASGDGNHRSSIFRLHIGRGLINSGLMPTVPSWGVPVLDRGAVAAEAEIEARPCPGIFEICWYCSLLYLGHRAKAERSSVS